MSCSVKDNCLNSHSCFDCCYDMDVFSEYGRDIYNPINRKIKHPIEEKRKHERKSEKSAKRKAETASAKLSKDKSRQDLLKKAAKAEEKVKSSLNSGRKSMDGDLHADDVMVDVKLQTTSKDWHVKRDEFLKAGNDAQRANKSYGVLAIMNSLDEVVYVISEEMFKGFIS